MPYPEAENDTGRGNSSMLRPDQFTKHTAPSTAARAFLELRGERLGAATIDEIHEALKRGGYLFDARDDNAAKAALRIALGKDVQVLRLPNGAYGIAAWYGRSNDRVERKRPQGDAQEPQLLLPRDEVAEEPDA